MEKFNVVRVRFHIEEKQTLVIQGWKYNMKPEDRLEITLDAKELPWVQNSYDGMEVRQRYMIYDLGIEEEYFLYVTLPVKQIPREKEDARSTGKKYLICKNFRMKLIFSWNR